MKDKAVRKAAQLKADNQDWKDLSLRLYLSGKECDGFVYGVSFDKPKKDDFHFPHKLSDGSCVDLVVDTESMKFVNESVIEWVSDDRGEGFLVENPNHKKFRGKFYRAKNWERRLS